MTSASLEAFFSGIFLKKRMIGSTTLYRRAYLTGSLSLLVFIIAWIYLAIEALFGQYNMLPHYTILMVLTIVTFVLNKKGHMAIARHFLLLTTAAFVYLFSSSEPIETGSFLNFIPLIVGAFILIGHRKRRYAIIYAVIIVSLFSLATLTDYSILPIRQYDESNIKYFLISNFLISSTATIFIVLFVNRLNHNIETRLRNNERNLNKLAGELELSRQRFELAIAGSNAGIYDWDIKHNIIYHSPIWKEMLGYEDKNFQDIPIEQFYDLLHPEDRPRVKKAVEAHLKGNKKYREELRLKHAEGNYVWFIDSGQAHWDHNGNPVRMVGSLINIDERKKAMDRIKKQNEMLEKTNNELDKFVYSTSHDLRAPLMSILGLINIAENSKDEDELKECLRLMAGRVNKLDEFINEIIDFSKNSRTEVAREQFMLDPVVRSVINELQYIENSDKIKFQYEFDPEFLLESDKKRFQIIIKNLLSNAIKYHNFLNKDPFISVGARRVNGSFELFVEDNGTGIDLAMQDRIFDMFFRATENAKGSGLGLYIVKETVNKLNGEIKVQSDYGLGSRFTVRIPVH